MTAVKTYTLRIGESYEEVVTHADYRALEERCETMEDQLVSVLRIRTELIDELALLRSLVGGISIDTLRHIARSTSETAKTNALMNVAKTLEATRTPEEQTKSIITAIRETWIRRKP